jgi:hypothetical protein
VAAVIAVERREGRDPVQRVRDGRPARCAHMIFPAPKGRGGGGKSVKY